MDVLAPLQRQKNHALTTLSLVRRSGFPITVAACGELAEVLEAMGPHASVDMDQALMCETMDVISRFAFGADFGTVQ